MSNLERNGKKFEISKNTRRRVLLKTLKNNNNNLNAKNAILWSADWSINVVFGGKKSSLIELNSIMWTVYSYNIWMVKLFDFLVSFFYQNCHRR